MYEYLQDKEFLYKLDNLKIKYTLVRLTILDFVSELPIRLIQGIATAGTLTVNGSSLIRRTISLTIRAGEEINDLTNVENLISIRTKIKVSIGLRKMFKDYSEYGGIGDYIWFPQGVFLISSASLTRNTSGCTISISGKDKMVLLDGSVGGTLPASTTFTEVYEYDAEGNITVTSPTIFRIIQDAVEHIGGLPADKIIITDLDEECKLLVKYLGDSPLYFNEGYDAIYFGNSPPDSSGWIKYTTGQDVGYMVTDFTYPDELTLNAGDTVVTLLNKIVSTLGNYEFFFDLEGNFIFLEIKNYLNTSYTPITEIGETTYVKNFSDSKYEFTLTDANTVTAFLNSPNYSNVKNDFIVWGTKETIDDTEIQIRYHLAVDVKPSIDLAGKYMYETTYTTDSGETALRYDFLDSATGSGTLIGYPCSEWREELYRLGLAKSISGDEDLWYSAELEAEWRELFDTTRIDWKTAWENNDKLNGNSWDGWNPEVYTEPSNLRYWLDFIDSTDSLALYSINMIGRRTKVVSDDDAKTIYNMEVPDVVFLDNPSSAEERSELIAQFKEDGLKYCLLNANQVDYFTTSSTPKSCYDEVRSLVYLYLTYNTSITVTCQPKYYLEPNQLIYVEDTKSGIAGDFVITSFTIPLSYNGTMSLVASEALTRV